MFVVTEDVCSVNAELVCDVSLPNLNLPVRGRVVWVQTAPRPGMGIEFLDLNESDLTALREVVATQGADQPKQQVKVWMEALPQPIRAEAVQTGQGVLLRSELSFLKLASPVLVYPADADQQQSEESYSGVLEEVSLTMNPEGNAPVLLLHMHFTPQESVEPVESVKLVEPAEEDLSEIPVEVDSERFGEDRICKPVEPEVAVEPKVVLGDVAAESGVADNRWELGLETDPCARSYWSLEGPEDVEVRSPRRRHPWLWSAALLMAGLAVASMAYTDLFPRARQKAQTWLAYAGLAQGAPVVSAPAEASRVEAPQAAPPLVRAPVLPSPTNADLELAKAPSAAPPAPSTPAAVAVNGLNNYKIVTSAQGDKELVVLLKGSTKEGKSYRLGNPDGVAFNLPSAQPQARYGSHPLDRSSAFRRVQIRKRSGGTQVRVLFWGSAPPYEVKVLPRQIRVTLLPDTRQAAGPSATAM